MGLALLLRDFGHDPHNRTAVNPTRQKRPERHVSDQPTLHRLVEQILDFAFGFWWEGNGPQHGEAITKNLPGCAVRDQQHCATHNTQQ